MTSNGRPSLDTVLLTIAAVFSRRSTCSRGHTGCVLARDGRIIATGYNGAPSGMPHCDHSCDCSPRHIPGDSSMWGTVGHEAHSPYCRSLKPCTVAVHAEANAVAFAAKYGVATVGTTLYTLFAPCQRCAELLVNAGVVRVVTTSSRPSTPESSVGSGVYVLEQVGITLDYAVAEDMLREVAT